jgi:hypothetical protein
MVMSKRVSYIFQRSNIFSLWTSTCAVETIETTMVCFFVESIMIKSIEFICSVAFIVY